MKVKLTIKQTRIVHDVEVNIPDMSIQEAKEWVINSNIADNHLDYAETETDILILEIGE